jgi:hypothetical protein
MLGMISRNPNGNRSVGGKKPVFFTLEAHPFDEMLRLVSIDWLA